MSDELLLALSVDHFQIFLTCFLSPFSFAGEKEAEVLLVLLEEELVAIDLLSPG